jgi:hypothetical protein
MPVLTPLAHFRKMAEDAGLRIPGQEACLSVTIL